MWLESPLHSRLKLLVYVKYNNVACLWNSFWWERFTIIQTGLLVLVQAKIYSWKQGSIGFCSSNWVIHKWCQLWKVPQYSFGIWDDFFTNFVNLPIFKRKFKMIQQYIEPTIFLTLTCLNFFCKLDLRWEMEVKLLISHFFIE